jgi:exosortase/archaeosortase family protein
MISWLKPGIFKNRTVLFFAVLFLLCCLFYSFFPDQYNKLLRLYMLSLFMSAHLLLNAIHIANVFNALDLSFTFDSFVFHPSSQLLALKYSFGAIALPHLFLKYDKFRKTVLLIFFCLLYVYSLVTLHIFFLLKSVSINHQVPGPELDNFFHLLMICLPLAAYLWSVKGQKGKIMYRISLEKIPPIREIIFFLLVYVFVKTFIPIFPGLILIVKGVLDFLTSIIFYISKLILSQFSINVIINGRILSDSNNSVNMGDPCVGAGVMIIFVIIIMLSEGRILQKAVFSILGLLIIIFLNSIRVSLLFAYLDETGSSHLSLHTWHTVYNTVIYISVIILWLTWSHLHARKSNQEPGIQG